MALKSIGIFNGYHPSVRIGHLIRDEVIPYARTFQVLPVAMQEEALTRARTESSQRYFTHLSDAWEAHNQLAATIDAFLVRSVEWSDVRIKDSFVRQACSLYEQAVVVEDEKRTYSAGVKALLDRAMHEALTRYRFSEKDMDDVFTLWEAPYWVYRNGAHAMWLLAERGVSHAGTPRYNRQKLCSEFHAGYDFVLDERHTENWLSRLINADTKTLLAAVQQWLGYGDPCHDARTRAGYLMLGRKDLKAARQILRYDNLIEPLFGDNLWGIPDLLLRKAVINTLVERGTLDRRASVLLYSIDEILIAEANNVICMRRFK